MTTVSTEVAAELLLIEHEIGALIRRIKAIQIEPVDERFDAAERNRECLKSAVAKLAEARSWVESTG